MIAASKKKRFFVLGMGRSGRAVARLLAERGSSVVVHDDDDAVTNAAVASAELEPVKDSIEIATARDAADRVVHCDTVVVSPGVPLEHSLLAAASKSGVDIIGEIEAAFSFCSSRIIGVTGTNGKSTVVSLLGGIFERTEYRSVVAGNIGTPFSEIVASGEEFDVVVLEISSFQLDTIKRFRTDVAVLLNVTADHLDRYGDSFDKYAESKSRILNRADADTVFVYNDEDETCRRIASGFDGVKIPFSSARTLDAGVYRNEDTIERRWQGTVERVMPAGDFSPVGIHNLQNALAAVAAATPFDVDTATIHEALREYHALPHRMELTRVVGGVAYVNDSKATNVDATIKSVRSIDGPVVLIMGGLDKAGDFQPLVEYLSHVKQVILIGEATAKIGSVIAGHSDVYEAHSMDEAVQEASETATAGDTVLLAPACASFDMFQNYAARGEAFRQAVSALNG